MDTKNIVLSCVLSVLGLAGAAEKSRAPAPAKLPNVVLIMADDMGKECIGAYGCTEYRTPNIDRLAAEGVRFTRCFSQALCTPSRIQLMTGKHNYRNYEHFGYLNPKEITFGNLLKNAGYSTCIAGKWQLNGLEREAPGNQDLDRPRHFGFDDYCLWQLTRKKKDGERYADPFITINGKDLPRNPDAYGPDIFSDFICDFIRQKSDRRFFVYYPMALIHDPFVPTPDSPKWRDPARRYEQDTAHVADMVAYTDKIVGKIVRTLKETGNWDNTLVLFTGDNGTKQGVVTSTKAGEVKGGKGRTINAGIHVPLIASWPGKIGPGTLSDRPVDFTDILPTLADVAGIDPASYATDGKSLRNAMTGGPADGKTEIFAHYSPRWFPKGDKSQHSRYVTNGRYKLYRTGEFYDTQTDPDETRPLKALSPNERGFFRKYDSILQAKEREFPFSWNDTAFQPGIR